MQNVSFDGVMFVIVAALVIAQVLSSVLSYVRSAKKDGAIADKDGLISELAQRALDLAENPKAISSLETVLSQHADIISQLIKGGSTLKSLTPDSVDKLIDNVSRVLSEASDGQPNV